MIQLLEAELKEVVFDIERTRSRNTEEKKNALEQLWSWDKKPLKSKIVVLYRISFHLRKLKVRILNLIDYHKKAKGVELPARE